MCMYQEEYKCAAAKVKRLLCVFALALSASLWGLPVSTTTYEAPDVSIEEVVTVGIPQQ